MKSVANKVACGNCAFCVVSDLGNDLKRSYTCVRFPPTANIIATPQGIATLSAKVTVQVDGYCGEFKMSE